MKVGDYVRYKTLSNKIKINRCLEIDDNVYILDKNEATCDKYIIKSSPNITDLIERFDLVNGHLVICKMYENEKGMPTIVKCVGDYYFKEEEIKSIVTREQFSQMEYKVSE